MQQCTILSSSEEVKVTLCAGGCVDFKIQEEGAGVQGPAHRLRDLPAACSPAH